MAVTARIPIVLKCLFEHAFKVMIVITGIENVCWPGLGIDIQKSKEIIDFDGNSLEK